MRIGQTRGFGEHCTVGIDNGGGQTEGGEAQTDEMGALEAAMDAAGDGVDGGGIIAGLEADGLTEQRQAIFGRATIAPGGDQPKGERGSDGRQGYGDAGQRRAESGHARSCRGGACDPDQMGKACHDALTQH